MIEGRIGSSISAARDARPNAELDDVGYLLIALPLATSRFGDHAGRRLNSTCEFFTVPTEPIKARKSSRSRQRDSVTAY